MTRTVVAGIFGIGFLLVNAIGIANDRCEQTCNGDVGCEITVHQCLLSEGDPRTAIDRLKPLVSEHPDNPVLARLLASAYLADGNAFWAERILTQVLENNPDDCETRSWLAWVYLQGGDLSLAKERLDEPGCPRSAADAARWQLIRYKIAIAEDDERTAAAVKYDFQSSEALYEEDEAVWRKWWKEAHPGWIVPLQLRLDVFGGYTTNARAGSPSDTVSDGEGSGLGRFDLYGRFVLPASKWVRPSLEGSAKGHGLTSESARELSYLDLSVRPGVLLGSGRFQTLVAYSGNMLLIGLDGKERFYETHRAEVEFETDFGLLIFGGAGRRIFAEMGRTRTELDIGIGGNIPLHSRFRLLAVLSGRQYFAVGVPYDQRGLTAVLSGRVQLPAEMRLGVGVTVSWDNYPHSGGDRGSEAFGTEEKRNDLLIKQFDELWSPLFKQMRLGIRYEFSYLNSTADDYDYEEHRFLAVFRLSLSLNPFAPKTVSSTDHVALNLGIKGETAMAEDDERIQDLLRQDEAARAGSSCVD